MRRRLVLPLILTAATLANPVSSQVVHHPHLHGGVTIGERHRYEMDRLQARSDQQEALARQQRLETRLTIQDLRSRRQPDLYQPAPYAPPRSVEQQSALREAATRQRQTIQAGVGQIDDWLDRPPQ